MPILNIWRCPVCGKESEASLTQPPNWISVGGSPGAGGAGNEVFDQWQCVATYAQENQPSGS
jgi:hypothetical protein